MDTSLPGTGGYGTLDQQHLFFYSAGWQILEELIDDDFQPTTPFFATETVEHCWGIRHIDDLVLQRRTVDGSPPVVSVLYHLTDHQFSTVALLDNAANLVERVSYDAYGLARHHWKGDISGDGAVGSAH